MVRVRVRVRQLLLPPIVIYFCLSCWSHGNGQCRFFAVAVRVVVVELPIIFETLSMLLLMCL